MTTSLSRFADHTLCFVRSALGGSTDPEKVKREAKEFLGTVQKVVFAVAVFMLMREMKASALTAAMLCNAAFYILPEVSLGMGLFLLFKGAQQILACTTSATPKDLALAFSVNLISGCVALRRYDQNHKNFISGGFDKVAQFCAPYVANRLVNS